MQSTCLRSGLEAAHQVVLLVELRERRLVGGVHRLLLLLLLLHLRGGGVLPQLTLQFAQAAVSLRRRWEAKPRRGLPGGAGGGAMWWTKAVRQAGV
jgi:hypothetical protein